MLPAVDLETAERWATLGARIGAMASHGAAHDPDPAAWVDSGQADVAAVLAALRACDGTLGMVVDWGAGAGRLIPWLAPRCDWLIAADVCPTIVEWEGAFPNLSTVVTDIPELAAPHGTVDLVVSLHVLYSVTPEGVRETVRQLGRLLKPGGALVLDVPYWEDLAWHRDPDPEGLPGGWWLHSAVTLMNGFDGLWLERVPSPLRFQHGAWPRWSDLAELKLWVWRKG